MSLTRCDECGGKQGKTQYHGEWVNCPTCKGHGILFNDAAIPPAMAPLLSTPELTPTDVGEVRQTMIAVARAKIEELHKLKEEAANLRSKLRNVEFGAGSLARLLQNNPGLKDDTPYFAIQTYQYSYYGGDMYHAELVLGVTQDFTVDVIKSPGYSIIPPESKRPDWWTPAEGKYQFYIVVSHRGAIHG
jgi:hypothetical protein